MIPPRNYVIGVRSNQSRRDLLCLEHELRREQRLLLVLRDGRAIHDVRDKLRTEW